MPIRTSRLRPSPERFEGRVLLATGALSYTAVPTPDVFFGGLAAGPNNTVWFAEQSPAKIGRLDVASNAITETALPTSNSDPAEIVPGPDNAIWFTETQGNRIGRIDAATLAITEYPVPTAGAHPTAITLGPDGNLWFVEQTTNRIGRITPAGVVTEFAVPTPNEILGGIAAGSDGNLWFTETSANQVAQLDPTTGTVAEFAIPTANSSPLAITAGPDGNLWFVEYSGDAVAKVTTDGTVTEYPYGEANPAYSSQVLQSITAGPDGNLYFTVGQDPRRSRATANFLVGITTAGTITINVPIQPFRLGVNDSFGTAPVGAITSSPNGRLYFAQQARPNVTFTPATQYIGQFNLLSNTTLTAPDSVNAVVGTPITYSVTFRTPNPNLTATDFATSIDFGDNTPPVRGVIVGDAATGFTLTATHTYSRVVGDSFGPPFRNFIVTASVRDPSGFITFAQSALNTTAAPAVAQANLTTTPAADRSVTAVSSTVTALGTADAATFRKFRHAAKVAHHGPAHAATAHHTTHAVKVTHAVKHPKAKVVQQGDRKRP